MILIIIITMMTLKNECWRRVADWARPGSPDAAPECPLRLHWALLLERHLCRHFRPLHAPPGSSSSYAVDIVPVGKLYILKMFLRCTEQFGKMAFKD